MNKEEHDDKKGIPFTMLIVFSVIIMIVGLVVYSFSTAHFDEVIDQCREDGKNHINASDDYLLGWNDCISHLKSLWSSGTNATG